MSGVQTVEEVMAEITAKTNAQGKKVVNRFNKKNFSKLVTAAANDPEFVSTVAVTKKGELLGTETIAVGAEFRKWVRKIVEEAGIDPNESGIVESSDFRIPNMDWAYNFFAEVLWRYLQNNRFDLLTKEDFNATISIKDVAESTTTSETRKPGSNEILGKFETVKKEHKELSVKGKCPKWLQDRRMK